MNGTFLSDLLTSARAFQSWGGASQLFLVLVSVCTCILAAGQCQRCSKRRWERESTAEQCCSLHVPTRKTKRHTSAVPCGSSGGAVAPVRFDVFKRCLHTHLSHSLLLLLAECETQIQQLCRKKKLRSDFLIVGDNFEIVAYDFFKTRVLGCFTHHCSDRISTCQLC